MHLAIGKIRDAQREELAEAESGIKRPTREAAEIRRRRIQQQPRVKSDVLPADTGHTRGYYLSKDKILLQ